MDKRYLIDNRKILIFTLSVISILYCLLRENIALNILSILLYLWVLLQLPPEYGIYILLYFAPWESFSATPVMSFLTIMELMLASKVIIYFLKNKLKLTLFDLWAFGIILIYGMLSFKVTGNVTVIRMSLIVLFGIYFKRITTRLDNTELEMIWKLMFYYLCVSALFGSLFGYLNILRGTALYSRRLGLFRIGTVVGIDRGCLLYCGGMIYPICYLKKEKWIRSILIAFFTFSILLTVSITAMATYTVFLLVYFFCEIKNNENNQRKMNLILGIGVLVVACAIIWNNGSGISAIDNTVNRIKGTFYYLQIGDYSNATTERTDIFREYQGTLSSMSLRERLFGTGYTSLYSSGLFSHYSHNTLLDLYTCFGAFTLTFLVIRKFKGVIYHKRRCKNALLPLLLLSVTYLLPCLSVSMVAHAYWFYFFLFP